MLVRSDDGRGSLEVLPRKLEPVERDLLLWVLPQGRPGYADYRHLVETWPIEAVGRRGEGNYILAEQGWTVDIESPLPQIFAYGVVEHEQGTVTVSIRERSGGQLEFEMEGVDKFATARETRRWTFSEWLPSQPCPSCGSAVWETRMTTSEAQTLYLVRCSKDRRIWVYDDRTGINTLIPVTGFYNELMLQTGNKDPKVAFDPKRLFGFRGAHREPELIRSFLSYNKLRNKVVLEGDVIVAGQPILNWIRQALAALEGKKNQTEPKQE
jgi:hypothetical protein